MSTVEWVLSGALTATWAGLGVSFAIGKWARSQEASTDIPIYRITQLERQMIDLKDFAVLENRVSSIEAQFDQASEKISKWAGQMIVLKAAWDAMEKRKPDG
jgi:hypothetical protein